MIWFSWGTDEYGKSYFRIYGIKVTMQRIGVLIALIAIVGVISVVTKKPATTSGSGRTTTTTTSERYYTCTQSGQPDWHGYLSFAEVDQARTVDGWSCN
jgi:hypothetical protein